MVSWNFPWDFPFFPGNFPWDFPFCPGISPVLGEYRALVGRVCKKMGRMTSAHRPRQGTPPPAPQHRHHPPQGDRSHHMAITSHRQGANHRATAPATTERPPGIRSDRPAFAVT